MADFTEAEIILRSMQAYTQNNPPPADVKAMQPRPFSTKMSQSRYAAMASYIAQQLELARSSIPKDYDHG